MTVTTLVILVACAFVAATTLAMVAMAVILIAVLKRMDDEKQSDPFRRRRTDR